MHKCRELLDAPGPDSTQEYGEFWLCGAVAAPATRLPCPAGRPDAVAGPYCAAHGGHARAELEARGEWNYAAPACVGNAIAVERAGSWVLTAEHLIVVVRPAGPYGRTGSDRWTVGLGIGTRLRQLPGTWETALLAERAAVEAWREAHDAQLAAIRAARGGTLDWGMSTYARDLPRVVACSGWERDAGNATWGVRRDPLPEALAAPLVAPRLGNHALRRARNAQKRGREE
jgi:hypothetical protein